MTRWICLLASTAVVPTLHAGRPLPLTPQEQVAVNLARMLVPPEHWREYDRVTAEAADLVAVLREIKAERDARRTAESGEQPRPAGGLDLGDSAALAVVEDFPIGGRPGKKPPKDAPLPEVSPEADAPTGREQREAVLAELERAEALVAPEDDAGRKPESNGKSRKHPSDSPRSEAADRLRRARAEMEEARRRAERAASEASERAKKAKAEAEVMVKKAQQESERRAEESAKRAAEAEKKSLAVRKKYEDEIERMRKHVAELERRVGEAAKRRSDDESHGRRPKRDEVPRGHEDTEHDHDHPGPLARDAAADRREEDERRRHHDEMRRELEHLRAEMPMLEMEAERASLHGDLEAQRTEALFARVKLVAEPEYTAIWAIERLCDFHPESAAKELRSMLPSVRSEHVRRYIRVKMVELAEDDREAAAGPLRALIMGEGDDALPRGDRRVPPANRPDDKKKAPPLRFGGPQGAINLDLDAYAKDPHLVFDGTPPNTDKMRSSRADGGRWSLWTSEDGRTISVWEPKDPAMAFGEGRPVSTPPGPSDPEFLEPGRPVPPRGHSRPDMFGEPIYERSKSQIPAANEPATFEGFAEPQKPEGSRDSTFEPFEK